MISEDTQLHELTQTILRLAVLDFSHPPPVHGGGPLDAIAAGLIALGEELKSTVVGKEEAEQANIAKGNFIAKMSHELKTPLTTIAGSSELLKRTPLTAQQKRLNDNLGNAANLLLRLINDILIFSNTDDDSIDVLSAPMDLISCIWDCIDKAETTAEKESLELFFKLTGPPSLCVMCDEQRLQQVFMNILSNSMKFTHQGEIHIRVSTKAEGIHQAITIDIEDAGIGMDEETLQRVFTPFFSFDSSLRRLYGGAGLGLTICRAIMNALGGSISVHSNLGRGTVVSLSIVLPSASTELKRSKAQDFSQLQGKRVLIADDTPLVAEVTQKMLECLGVEVTVVKSGIQTLSLPSVADFDAILMDCQMPIMDGLQTTRELLKAFPESDLRIIAFSANSSDEFIESCLDAGMVHHIQKPFTIDILATTLQQFSR